MGAGRGSDNAIRFNIKELFEKYEIDLLWVKNLPSIEYLTGFTGSTANLLTDEDERKWLLVDSRYTTQSKEECPGSKVREIQKPLEDLCEVIREIGAKSLGFEAGQASFSDYQTIKKEIPDVKLVPIEDNLASLRILKTPEEIEKLKKASALADQAYREALEALEVGWSENDAAWFFERHARENGASGVSFETLVCSGPRSAIVHGKAGDKKLEEGELVIFDRGIILERYCSDETNTFVLGKMSGKQREVYQIVKDAHDRCIESIKPGMNCVDIDAVARTYIEEKGFSDYFGHGTGHGVGIEVHELPMISPRGKGFVEEGMVFSVEPGIYIPGWGGVRIEDLVLVTADGCKIITLADKNMFEIKTG